TGRGLDHQHTGGGASQPGGVAVEHAATVPAANDSGVGGGGGDGGGAGGGAGPGERSGGVDADPAMVRRAAAGREASLQPSSVVASAAAAGGEAGRAQRVGVVAASRCAAVALRAG